MTTQEVSLRAYRLIKNPTFILYLLVLILAVFVLLKAKDYGIIWDSYAQNNYGDMTYHWYVSLGKDQSFLGLFNIRNHGPFVETIETAAKHLSISHGWYIRNVVTGFLGIAGIVAVYLCGVELGLPWVGVIGAIILILMPRYFGDMIVNSKDVPFAAAMTFILWTFLRLLNRWKTHYVKESIFVGIAIGIANAIRITSIMWYVFLFIILVIYWFLNFRRLKRAKSIWVELKKQIISALVIGAVSYALTILLWPYVLLSPINNLIESIQMMSKFPWDGQQIFTGQFIHATAFPRSYIPIWLLISTPLITLVLALLGLGTAMYKQTKWYRYWKYQRMSIVVLYLVFLILSLVILKPNLADAIRQVLFILPPLCLLAGYGAYSLVKSLHRKNAYAAMIASILILLFYVSIIGTMVSLHPYEYVYFNETVGGLSGAYNRFETDYYGACIMNANLWLGDNYKAYTQAKQVTINGQGDGEPYLIYLPGNFTRVSSEKADFYEVLSPSKYNNPFPKAKTIYTVERFGAPLCEVKAPR